MTTPDYPRDMIGYGRVTPQPQWPTGADRRPGALSRLRAAPCERLVLSPHRYCPALACASLTGDLAYLLPPSRQGLGKSLAIRLTCPLVYDN